MDLQRLKQIAKAATPGRWQWWTSNSFMRLSVQGGVDGGVLSGARLSDGQCTVAVSNEDAAHIEAFDPQTVLILIAEIERLSAPADTITAQPVERRADWIGTQDALHPGYVKVYAREPIADERAAAEAEYASIYTGGGGGGRSMFVRGWQARAALQVDEAEGKDAERYRWLKMTSSPGEQRSLLSIPWGRWDDTIDAAMAAQSPASDGQQKGK